LNVPTKVHLDHVREDLQVVRALPAGRPLRPPDPGAAHRDPQPALGRRGIDRGPDGRLVGDVGLGELGALAELRGQRPSSLGVEVGDHHPGTGGVQAARGGGAEPRRSPGDQRARSLDLHRRGRLSAS